MRITRPPSTRGIALIVVLIAIFVLSAIAGAFAYAMKVETKLALNLNHDSELEWLGRSGVEYARWILAQGLKCPYDSLQQKWAGGPGSDCETNGPLATISLDNIPIGDGTVTLKISDLERKVNINIASPEVLKQGLMLMGVDASEIDSVADSMMDWIDTDNATHLAGAESDYYEGLEPPYSAKNAPFDDLSELLFVRGVTLEMYAGSGSSEQPAPGPFQPLDRSGRPVLGYSAGLVDLFTPMSSGKVNINTASRLVLQMIPGIDETTADCILRQREEMPFNNVGELATCVPQAMQQVQRLCTVRSTTFEVEVDASIGGARRTFHAILGRSNQREIQVLSFYWK
jgi:type II secretory pathway component PulK